MSELNEILLGQDCLNGEFVRVGPNLTVAGYHWFDGDGYICFIPSSLLLHSLCINCSHYIVENFGGPKFKKHVMKLHSAIITLAAIYSREESHIYTLKHRKPDHETPHVHPR